MQPANDSCMSAGKGNKNYFLLDYYSDGFETLRYD